MKLRNFAKIHKFGKFRSAISNTYKLKNGKAAGPDGIPSEALKVDVEATAEILLPLFRKI